MDKILVATDGSENAKRGLIQAEKYARYTGAEITILTIAKSLDRTMPIDDLIKKQGEKVLDESLEVIGNLEGRVKTKIRKGNPANEIIDEAEDGDYDLIIMGSRGLGTFSGAILGSVSNKVLNYTKTNVLVVK